MRGMSGGNARGAGAPTITFCVSLARIMPFGLKAGIMRKGALHRRISYNSVRS